ncbi:MAG: helix-turn-helix domain-containing protein [Oscillospiraceae bacterium]|nr:helix-turn-helix domain-containing protein [Oscillospiraceae bacterium]
MAKELFSLAERIKELRRKSGKTQTELAKALGLTRSGVNAWEMGVSVPSTPYIVELAKYFHVSTDYILGMEKSATFSLIGLSDEQIDTLKDVARHFRDNIELSNTT